MIELLTMEKVNSSFVFKVLPRAFLICLVCLSLIAFSSYTAPKAQAEAISLSLTTAFLMLVIAVMSTLGVTLTASSVDVGVNYIHDPFISFLQGKGYSSITEYLASAGITAVSQLCIPVFGAVNIAKSVYDIIADFCTSFFAEKNIVSGGDPVGILPADDHLSFTEILGSYMRGSAIPRPISDTSFKVDFDNWYKTNSNYAPSIGAYIPLVSPIVAGNNTFTITREVVDGFQGYYPATSLGVLGLDGKRYSGVDFSFDKEGNATVNYNATNTNQIGSSTIILYLFPYTTPKTGTIIYSVAQSDIPVGSDFFTITASEYVSSPPQIAIGQTYSVPSPNTRADDDNDTAISDVVAPLTTTGGLTKQASITGSAVAAEWKWLYEDTQSIRNNTNPHFDFIPSSLGFDFSIWHYVAEMMTSVNSAISLLGTFIQNMPSAILVFPFGVFALCITVALFRRFLS